MVTEASKKGEDPTVEAINRLAQALIEHQPKSPLELSGISKERQHALTTAAAPKRWRAIPGKSPDTGATFTMIVIESKVWPSGRVTEIRDYKYPSGMYKTQSNGGIVPEGMPIYADPTKVGNHLPEGEDPPTGILTNHFKQWRWTQFYQTDLRQCVGKELRQHYCREADGMKTAWQDGHVYTSQSAAE
jgi:hypothetical protein